MRYLDTRHVSFKPFIPWWLFMNFSCLKTYTYLQTNLHSIMHDALWTTMLSYWNSLPLPAISHSSFPTEAAFLWRGPFFFHAFQGLKCRHIFSSQSRRHSLSVITFITLHIYFFLWYQSWSRFPYTYRAYLSDHFNTQVMSWKCVTSFSIQKKLKSL